MQGRYDVICRAAMLVIFSAAAFVMPSFWLISPFFRFAAIRYVIAFAAIKAHFDYYFSPRHISLLIFVISFSLAFFRPLSLLSHYAIFR